MAQLEALVGDITNMPVDAIVNAANETLLGGGGVDGAIHRAAGPQLLAACRQLPELQPGVRCITGSAQITDGFKLKARYVIHTVGPIWQGGQASEEQLLASCYRSVIALAVQHQALELAFPAISCGVYGFPRARAAEIAVQTLRESALEIRKVQLVAFDQDMLRHYQTALQT